MKSKIVLSIVLLFAVSLTLCQAQRRDQCTSAIIGPQAASGGVPMLWKNRDTSYLSNKVIYVNEKPFSYIGLINHEETSGRFVYAGLNSQGFGIINTVAYNLPKKEKDLHDLEGLVMATALRTCRTVDDFEAFLKSNLGETLGSWTNFGVIDGQGNAVIFEAHNNGYKKIDTADNPAKYLVNTNFARTGKKGKGAGYLRFERASQLFNELGGHKVTHSFIFQKASRDLGHPLLTHPTLEQLAKRSVKQPLWIYNRDCINRPSTASAVVINGKKPGEKDSIATFWVLLGEPVTSIAVPVWVEAGQSPLPLWQGKEAPVYVESARIRKMFRPFTEGSKENYMEVTRLVNKEGTGFLPLLMETEREIFSETADFLKSKHTPAQYAAFQEKMAQKALLTLKNVN